MKVTFISNFLNHHQKPICEELIKEIGDNFTFVATEKIPMERLNLGYEDINEKYKYVKRAYENENYIYDLIENSDIIIIGSAPDKYINYALKHNKICFRYNERKFKSNNFLKNMLVYIKILFLRSLREKKVYILCASAFTRRDFNIAGAYKNKCYKWGYFPEVLKYNIDELIKNKDKKKILWVGRFVKYKHPEKMIMIAKELLRDGYDFKIEMIGSGKLKNKLINTIKKEKLENYINVIDSMSPVEVRGYMEKASMFIFTSDKGEGWGAVLNEAMNSACIVIADSHIGSVPYLINNEVNGYIYDSNKKLIELVKKVIDNNNYLIMKRAYETMSLHWNPKEAAKRLLCFFDKVINNQSLEGLYLVGPLSKAEYLTNDWYKDGRL